MLADIFRTLWSNIPAGLWLARLAVALVSFSAHELAHTLAALALGDPTARENGRLTLNPFKHVEWIGLLTGVFIGLGWSRPSPIRPHRMRVADRLGGLLAVLAGPLANLGLLLVGLRLLDGLALEPAPVIGGLPSLGGLLTVLVRFNLGLVLLNLLPLFPLDAYAAVRFLLPLRASAWWERMSGWTTSLLGAGFALLVMLPAPLVSARLNPFIHRLLAVLLGW